MILQTGRWAKIQSDLFQGIFDIYYKTYKQQNIIIKRLQIKRSQTYMTALTKPKSFKQSNLIESIQVKSVESLMQKRQQALKHLKPIGIADTFIYHVKKQSGIFGRKQQHIMFEFFMGLNTYPQNLSAYFQDFVNQVHKVTHSKQSITKGQFIMYNMFTQTDFIVQINIPYNFQIYKQASANKKQPVSNQQLNSTYVSSMIRAMYGKGMSWGKCYNIFGKKNLLQQFKTFMGVFLSVIQEYDIDIGDDYERKSTIKGSQACYILLDYIRSKCIQKYAIEYIQSYIEEKGGYEIIYYQGTSKVLLLLAQLYSSIGKNAVSLKIVCMLINAKLNGIGSQGISMNKSTAKGTLSDSKIQTNRSVSPQVHKNVERDNSQVCLLFYQAKYMYNMIAVHESLLVINNIIQYNLFQIWQLAAEVHLYLKNYNEALICLNHASKLISNRKQLKYVQIQHIYAQFTKIGKVNYLCTIESQLCRKPKLMLPSDSPVSSALTQQASTARKNENYLQIIITKFWSLDQGQKIIYDMLKKLKYSLKFKKFQQLIENTFFSEEFKEVLIDFKTGIDLFQQDESEQDYEYIETLRNNGNKYIRNFQNIELQIQRSRQKSNRQLPSFVQDRQQSKQIQNVNICNESLSIIPELSEIIQTTARQQRQRQSLRMGQKQPQTNIKLLKYKKQKNQEFTKILNALQTQKQFQQAEHERNLQKILPIYEKIRRRYPTNNYYLRKLFQVLMQQQRYRAVVILIVQTLTIYEKMGKIQVLPFWAQFYLFKIIQERGLKALNNLLQKQNILNQAIIDTIELAKNWKIRGINF